MSIVETEKKKSGRPKVVINWDQFESLCGLHCTQSEIASFLKINADTLRDRAVEYYGEDFSVVYKKFLENGKCSLRRDQRVIAKKNATMAIWLGKQYLGQKDLPQEAATENTLLQFNALMNQILSLQSAQKIAETSLKDDNKSI